MMQLLALIIDVMLYNYENINIKRLRYQTHKIQKSNKMVCLKNTLYVALAYIDNYGLQ